MIHYYGYGDGMENILMKDNKADFFTPKMMFQKPINFKVYMLDDLKNSGYIEHFHSYMQIWYVCQGICSHWINNKCYRMVKGDIFVLPPYVVHKTVLDDEKGVKVIGCEFSAEFFDNKLEEFTRDSNFFDFAFLEPFLVAEDKVRPKLSLTASVQDEVERLMNNMLNEYNEEKLYYEKFLKADLLKLLAIVAREYEGSINKKESGELLDKYRTAIINAIKYINNNYTEDIHLDDICKYSMMSKTYFCYIFKMLTQKTFTEYLLDLRIKKALELLQTTDISITKICYEVGFNDVTHFCRTFKKIVGVSAKSYRNLEA